MIFRLLHKCIAFTQDNTPYGPHWSISKIGRSSMSDLLQAKVCQFCGGKIAYKAGGRV